MTAAGHGGRFHVSVSDLTFTPADGERGHAKSRDLRANRQTRRSERDEKEGLHKSSGGEMITA